MNKVIFGSYNVHGLNHPIKRKKILNQLKKLKCLIALLQETHLSGEENEKLKREWVNQVYYASYGKRRGVTILIHKSVPFVLENVIKDPDGRYVMIVGTVGDTVMTIVNIYALNEDDDKFFKTIANVIVSKGRGMMIIGGDFNVVQNGRMDRLPPDHSPGKT